MMALVGERYQSSALYVSSSRNAWMCEGVVSRRKRCLPFGGKPSKVSIVLIAKQLPSWGVDFVLKGAWHRYRVAIQRPKENSKNQEEPVPLVPSHLSIPDLQSSPCGSGPLNQSGTVVSNSYPTY